MLEVLKHNFKNIFLVIGFFVLCFIIGFMTYCTFEYVRSQNRTTFEDLISATDIEYRLKSLEYYKKTCIKKTQDQHRINNIQFNYSKSIRGIIKKHKPVIDYFLENEPDLKPAFDLNEIKDKKAE